MTLVRVESIPEKMPSNKNMNNLIGMFDDFLASDMKYAHVVWQPYGYANVNSARAALYQTRRRNNYKVGIVLRNGEIYLTKKGV